MSEQTELQRSWLWHLACGPAHHSRRLLQCHSMSRSCLAIDNGGCQHAGSSCRKQSSLEGRDCAGPALHLGPFRVAAAAGVASGGTLPFRFMMVVVMVPLPTSVACH